MTAPDSSDAGRTDEIAAPAPAEGDLLAGRYELLRRLGAGGMSRVFLAHDRDLGRSVAVKVLLRSRDEQDVARLRDEARAAASIEHPGVVTVHDVGATAAGVHVVMSYVEGESLAERIDRHGPLPPGEVVAIGLAVCDALGAAHRAGVVHRDVSPGNIMLGPDGGVTVTDFGIARVGDGAGRTATGHIVGTPAYIAPEQGRGAERLDGRADLYALACCLFAALTGRPPFTDPDPVSVVLAHIRQSPPRPSALRDGVPATLDRVLLRALAKDPARRHRDAAEMAADLATAGSGGGPAGREAGPGTVHPAGPGATGRDPVGPPPDSPGGPARTRELPAGGGTLDLPRPRAAPSDGPSAGRGAPGAEPAGGPVDRAATDAEDAEAARSDRRRAAGTILIAVAALLVLGVVVGLVVLG